VRRMGNSMAERDFGSRSGAHWRSLIARPGSWETRFLFAAFVGSAIALATIGEPMGTSAQVSDNLPLQLSWTAPAACPSANSVREEILRRVGATDRDPVSEPIVAEVEIHATSTGSFQLSLRTTAGEAIGERELSGRDCGQLADAVALVLALLISPKAPLAPEPPPRQATPAAEQPSVRDQSVSRLASVPRFAVGIDGVVGLGVLPAVAEGLDLRFVLQSERWAAMIRTGGFFAQDSEAPIFPGARASFYRLEWALALCAQSSAARRAGVAACLGSALVRLHGESAGVASSGGASAFWPEALAEVSAHVRPVPWTRLHLSLEGHFLGHAPDFAILGLGSVYRPAGASLRGALGFDVLF
jgi:hypothetical protein